MTAKKKKRSADLKRVSKIRKLRNEIESLCKKCGLCCHIKIGLLEGTYVVHPMLHCKFLRSDNLCSIYDKRLKMNPPICRTIEFMINNDYLLPEGCPYSELRKGYKPSKVVSQEEFDLICAMELLSGNYNFILAEDLIDLPLTEIEKFLSSIRNP